MIQTEFASNMPINFLPFHCKKACPRFEFHFTDKNYTSFIPPNFGKMGIQWGPHFVRFFRRGSVFLESIF